MYQHSDTFVNNFIKNLNIFKNAVSYYHYNQYDALYSVSSDKTLYGFNLNWDVNKT